MKKRKTQSSPIVAQQALEVIVMRIVESVQAMSQRKQTKAQRLAVQILSRCLVNRYASEHPEPFGRVGDDFALDASQLWLSGDLASGRGGSEFMYVYSPTRFVEDLLAEAIKITSAPIKVSRKGAGEEAKLSSRTTKHLTETFTTSATVYVLNNLRFKLDEAMEDLFFEARTIMEELYRTTLDSSLSELSGMDEDPIQIGRSRFTNIIKRMVSEGDVRKRKRLRTGLWEIARGRGRPKGAIGRKAGVRFSKERFRLAVEQRIRELSRTSEANITRKEVATALGLPNAKALDRYRRQFGDRRGWREMVDATTAGGKSI